LRDLLLLLLETVSMLLLHYRLRMLLSLWLLLVQVRMKLMLWWRVYCMRIRSRKNSRTSAASSRNRLRRQTVPSPGNTLRRGGGAPGRG